MSVAGVDGVYVAVAATVVAATVVAAMICFASIGPSDTSIARPELMLDQWKQKPARLTSGTSGGGTTRARGRTELWNELCRRRER